MKLMALAFGADSVTPRLDSAELQRVLSTWGSVWKLPLELCSLTAPHSYTPQRYNLGQNKSIQKQVASDYPWEVSCWKKQKGKRYLWRPQRRALVFYSPGSPRRW